MKFFTVNGDEKTSNLNIIIHIKHKSHQLIGTNLLELVQTSAILGFQIYVTLRNEQKPNHTLASLNIKWRAASEVSATWHDPCICCTRINILLWMYVKNVGLLVVITQSRNLMKYTEASKMNDIANVTAYIQA